MKWIKDNWVPVLIVAIMAIATGFFLNDLGVFSNTNDKVVEEMRQEHEVLKMQYETQRKQLQEMKEALKRQDARYEEDKALQRIELKRIKQKYEELLNEKRGIDATLPARPTFSGPVS